MYNFVSERQKYEAKILNVNGEIARKVYEDILKTPSTLTSTMCLRARTTPAVKKNPEKVVQRLPFDEKRFFKAASTNDLTSLQKMDINSSNVNQRDQFGWTALMMAACEGSIDTFRFLHEQGADLNACDKKGNSAKSLAQLKRKTNILDVLEKIGDERWNANDTSDEIGADEPADDAEFYCDDCDKSIKESDRIEHFVSTLHRFNQKDSYKFTRRFGIPDSNVGFQMMLRQGWDREKGLGPEQEGHLYPIKTTIRKPRSGLGVKQAAKAKVTHFAPCDPRAVKATRPPIPKAKTKRDLKREQSRNQRKERFFRNLLS